MRTLIGSEYGSLNAFTLTEGEIPQPTEGEVRLKVEATALGFVDALIALGRYQIRPALPYVPGGEIVGAWCTDRLVGVEELGGVGERPFPAPRADRAVQAEPGPPPPHPAPAAPGHELAGLRRQLTPARKFDGLVHRRSDHSLEG